MKKYFNFKYGVLAVFATVFLVSCDPEIDVASPSAGSNIDLTKYVAVGNSLTAGFSDGGLYREVQLSSYPALLAAQFKRVGGGDFTQPLFAEAQRSGSGYLRIAGFDASGLPILQPVTTNLAVRGLGEDSKTPLYTKYPDEVQNLGIPGILMANVTMPGYGFNNSMGFNPYYERLLGDAPAVTDGLMPYVSKVESTNPTFFTMWLGNNDVLGYATSGGTGAITDMSTFQTNLDAIVAVLTKNGAKGMIINLPDVTGIPYFTTKATASLIQMAAAAGTKLYITANDGNIREASTNDYVLLTSTVGVPEQVPGIGTIPHGFSPLNPLRNNEVLDNAEVALVQQATTQFNQALAAKAQSADLGLVDVNTFFERFMVQEGRPALTLNAVAYSTAFITGNIFSLDGVHLTPRGNAIVANKIIDDINAKYNARIPKVDENNYRAVVLP